jgi:hypothetical protein
MVLLLFAFSVLAAGGKDDRLGGIADLFTRLFTRLEQLLIDDC